jgi:hypothetical protein
LGLISIILQVIKNRSRFGFGCTIENQIISQLQSFKMNECQNSYYINWKWKWTRNKTKINLNIKTITRTKNWTQNTCEWKLTRLNKTHYIYIYIYMESLKKAKKMKILDIATHQNGFSFSKLYRINCLTLIKKKMK